jgi:uncharacterized protein (DUF427 family)
VLTSTEESVVVRVEPVDRRVRGVLAGETIVDSRRPLLLFEKGHLPVYYFPVEDVRTDLMEPTAKHTRCPRKGKASYWTVRVGDVEARNAMWRYEDPIEGCPDISGHVAFYWDKVDSWWEEDDQVFRHARDPYHRVDVLRSSRHVRLEIDGELVAESRRPLLLFETGLPTRYYLPRADVRMELFQQSDKHTRCPYKGVASYFSVEAGGRLRPDIAWTYETPIPECPKIEQAVAFFNEHVDLVVDGELLERLKTQWS